MRVNEKLRAIRQSKGITQKFVAKSLGIHTATYNGYELGRRKIHVELLKDIAEVLDEPIQNFLKTKYTNRRIITIKNPIQHRRRTLWLISVSHLITCRTKRFSKLLKRFAKKLISKAWRTAQKIHVSSNIKNTHLQEIFQIKSAAVTRLTGIESFPKLKTIQARYPRDLVFEWIKQNSTWVEENTNYFQKGVS